MKKRKLSEFTPNDDLESQEQMISRLLKSANTAYNTHQYLDAIESSNKILILDKSSRNAYFIKIRSLLSLNIPEEAIDCCNLAITNCNNNARFYNNKAVILYQIGKIQSSMSCYDAALKQTPDFPEIYYNFANLLCELDGYKEAIQYYDIALALEPNYTNARNNRELAYDKLIHSKHIEEDITILGEINFSNGNTEA